MSTRTGRTSSSARGDPALIEKIRETGYLLTEDAKDGQSLSKKLTEHAEKLQAEGKTRDAAMAEARRDIFGDADTVEELQHRMQAAGVRPQASSGQRDGDKF